MIKKISVLFLLAVIYLPSNAVFAQVTTNALLAEHKIVPVIELKGGAYERGFQHGTKLKKEIADVFAKWKMNIRETTKGDPDSVLNAFRAAINFEPITRKYIPGLLDEMRGMATASGQTYADVFAFQLVDEFWVYLDKQSNTTNHHCSGIGVPATANHPAYIAQNMDLENYMNGYQVLLHLMPTATEPEQYIPSCAGLVALNGMNDKGIGLCMNTLMELEASTDGLPVAFIIRAVLAKNSGADALKFLQTVKHASGQNYILGIGDSVYNFEASSNKVVRFFPVAGSSLVYHTNHALANHDVKAWYKKHHAEVLAGETKNNNSEARFTSLQERLNRKNLEISMDTIKNTLRSKDNVLNPVCRPFKEGGGGFTFSSILFTLGGKRSVQLTYGSPDQSEYREYFFLELF
jgi:isopenicillin-N N-acyltransferase-like protein